MKSNFKTNHSVNINIDTFKKTKRKKNQQDFKEELKLTDFSQQPIPGNINNIEIGDFVKLQRSMFDDSTNTLWFSGVEVRVKELNTLPNGIVIAHTLRIDGTPVKLFACWLTPIFIEEHF